MSNVINSTIYDEVIENGFYTSLKTVDMDTYDRTLSTVVKVISKEVVYGKTIVHFSNLMGKVLGVCEEQQFWENYPYEVDLVTYALESVHSADEGYPEVIRELQNKYSTQNLRAMSDIELKDNYKDLVNSSEVFDYIKRLISSRRIWEQDVTHVKYKDKTKFEVSLTHLNNIIRDCSAYVFISNERSLPYVNIEYLNKLKSSAEVVRDELFACLTQEFKALQNPQKTTLFSHRS